MTRSLRSLSRVVWAATAAIVFAGVALTSTGVSAQPITDSVRAMQLRNEKMYRQINALDDRGASYEFTNVTAWKVVDDELKNQIITVFKNYYGERRMKDYEPDDVYIFSAPAGQDRVEPFHVLFMGRRIAQTENADEVDPFFSGGRSRRSNEKIPVAFKGKDVVRLMYRLPALADNINAIQGEIVELPGDILPSGVQLVKSSAQRYIYHQMFTGFYAKRQIIQEQRRNLGYEVDDEEYIPSDSLALEVPFDPDQTAALPDEALASRAFRYDKTVDLSANHLYVNASRNLRIDVELGNPEVGLPFTSSGQGRALINMKNLIGRESNFRFGVEFPTFLPEDEFLLFPRRRLSGGWGGHLDAYFAGIDFFSAFNMPVAFSVSILPAGGDNSSVLKNGVVPVQRAAGPGDTIAASRTFYRSSLIGNLRIPIIVQLDPANFMEFSAGIGIHNVYQSFIPTASDFSSRTKTERMQFLGFNKDQIDKVVDLQRVSTPVTPHVELHYVNHRVNKFGLDIMYDHLFTFGGWLELWDNVLRVEASYSAPIVRDPKPYEPSSFFMITPRIYF